jgi:hypothetical protein
MYNKSKDRDPTGHLFEDKITYLNIQSTDKIKSVEWGIIDLN